MFDGQFWVLLIEKYEDDGTVLIGKHTFGPEPTRGDIVDFCMNKYHLLMFRTCDTPHRIKKKYKQKEAERNTGKAFAAFGEEQKKYLLEKKKKKSIEKRKSAEMKYEQKRDKRKKKRRGR